MAWAVYFEEPVSYARGVEMQERVVAARLEEKVPDTVLFLEHKPVVTLGARGDASHLLLSPSDLARLGIELAHASRGGDITYHGPGQLVLYPIIKLGANEADSHGYLRNLEETAIRTAADFCVRAFRRDGLTGAWTRQGKLAAIGIRLKRWVTFHGMSFNVAPDLKGFGTIVPCGLAGEPVTSLKDILGPASPRVAVVRESMRRHFGGVCGRNLTPCTWPELEQRLR
ncbi:MAG: lipoyl(octanoyl) transferase LipB [Kiritimatiellae bacterium]|nr:lipoyl(octanoyl) transferase LipB [Kiritimatiellia bacterium]